MWITWGEGVVKASDIKVSSGSGNPWIPTLVLAHLSGKDAKIYMEMKVSKRKGYDGANTRDHSDLAIGVIAVDAIYSPVKKVNVFVEEQSNTERLILDVTTDRTMMPEEAVSWRLVFYRPICSSLCTWIPLQGSRVLLLQIRRQEETSWTKSIDELELSVRSYNCLKRAGINTVEDLCAKTMDDLMKVRNMGRKSLDEILNKLGKYGIVPVFQGGL